MSTLIRLLDVVDALRFVNQFQAGSGDYTVERVQLAKGDTVKSVIAGIKAHRDR